MTRREVAVATGTSPTPIFTLRRANFLIRFQIVGLLVVLVVGFLAGDGSHGIGETCDIGTG